MKVSALFIGACLGTIVGLGAGLTAIYFKSIYKPEHHSRFHIEIREETYPNISNGSRTFPKTEPSLPSHGYVN